MKEKFRNKIIILTVLLLLSIRFSGLGSGFVSASDITVNSVISAVNNERSSRNIPTLRTDSRLSAAAQSKATDMIVRKYFAHVDPDGHYIWDKIVADGYTPYTILGENLAIDFSDTASLVAAWINSPTHRANLLNAGFKDQGMGVAVGDPTQQQYSIAIANTFGAQPSTTPKAPSNPTTSTSGNQNSNSSPKQQALKNTKPTAPAVEATTTEPTTPIASPTPITIAADKTTIAPSLTDTGINLHISGETNSNATIVMATVGSQSAALPVNGTKFEGDLPINNNYLDFSSSTLVLGATDTYGNTTSISMPLKGISLPENPKTTGSSAMYNLFKYIVIFFGAIFIIFLIGDGLFFSKKKITDISQIGYSSNLLLLVLTICTLVLVRWWN